MSRQLSISAAISTIAMLALAAAMAFGGPMGGDESRAATAHGSLISVLFSA